MFQNELGKIFLFYTFDSWVMTSLSKSFAIHIAIQILEHWKAKKVIFPPKYNK